MTNEQVIQAAYKGTMQANMDFFSNSKIVSLSEASRLLGISRPTIYKRIKQGLINTVEGGIERTELFRLMMRITQ